MIQPAGSPRGRWQYSLHALFCFTVALCLLLGVYRLAGMQAVSLYGLLIFAVGPWFAYLACECLPIDSPAVRRTLANCLLVGILIAAIFLAEAYFIRHSDAPAAAYLGPVTLILWGPQYWALYLARRDPP